MIKFELNQPYPRILASIFGGWAIFIAVFLGTSIFRPSLLFAQNYSTTLYKTAHFQNANNPKNELRVYNINGSVTVEGYNGNKIQVTAKEHIKGDKKQVQRGRSDLHLAVKRFESKIVVYIGAPFAHLSHHHGHFDYDIHRHNDNWNDDDNYKFLFDIHIKVPKHAAVHVSTINKGEVSVKNTVDKVFASNINGNLSLIHISGETHASTINGNITVKYDRSPGKNSEFHTINGDIKAWYPQDLSADIRFKSMHGDLFTNFNNIKHLKQEVHKDTRSGKTFYRIGRSTKIRIGKGGPTYSFRVLNGDVTIKKNQS
jgi:hypothetical protein